MVRYAARMSERLNGGIKNIHLHPEDSRHRGLFCRQLIEVLMGGLKHYQNVDFVVPLKDFIDELKRGFKGTHMLAFRGVQKAKI